MLNFSRHNNSNFAIWFRNIDKTILSTILLLFFLGLFFSFSSTSSVVADKLNTEKYAFFTRHLFFVFLALFFIFGISFQKKELIYKVFPYFFFLVFFLLLLVPLIGSEVKGSKRWLDLFFLPRFQPIELLKPFFVLIIAKILSLNIDKNLYKKYFLTLLILSFVILLLIIQPDLGQSILLFSTWLIMIFLSGINLIILLSFFLISLIAVIMSLFFFPDKFGYILLRLKTFISPETGNNYQSDKALESIINGGFFGQGIGEGVLKDRVPEAHTDYIIAVIAEEFGLLFILILMIIFLFFSFNVIKKTINENSIFIKLTLLGLMSIILIQTFIHVGVNIRLFPTTGMTLPFISYGGSSIVGNSIIAGLIIGLTKKE